MKTTLKLFFKPEWLLLPIFLLLFLNPFLGQGQKPAGTPTPDIKIKSVAREIMRSAENCALVSIDEEGRARVRTMDPFAPDSSFVVWLGTSAKSRKVSQIEKKSAVTLYYLTPDNTSYVCIYGEAFLVNDSTSKEIYWRKKWEDFYPDRKKDYLLIKVVPQLIEVLSYREGLYKDTINWQPFSITFEKEAAPDLTPIEH